MRYGVTFDTYNTLTEWGLFLKGDLKISSPKLKSNRVDIPGANGTKDMSYALTGYPVFEDRQVQFNLFKRCDDMDLDELRMELMNRFHGRKCKLWTPNNADYYWYGTPEFGEHSGYNSGTIPCAMIVDPYRYKNDPTVVTMTLAANTQQQKTLHNAGMPTIPVFNCTSAAAILCKGNTYNIAANTDYRNLGLMLIEDPTVIKVTAEANATMTITYQEGSL